MRQSLLGGRDSLLVPIQSDERRIVRQFLRKRQRMTAPAQRPVYINAVWIRQHARNRLRKKHTHMMKSHTTSQIEIQRQIQRFRQV